MDSERFDRLVRSFGQTRSRRQTLGALAGVALGVGVGVREVAAGEVTTETCTANGVRCGPAPDTGRVRRSCSTCCSQCTARQASGQKRCSCCRVGRACRRDDQCCSGTCTGGVCSSGAASCDANTCPDGCCAGTACAEGTTEAACGTGGAACAACESGQRCRAGACADCLALKADCTDAAQCCQDDGALACGPLNNPSQDQCCRPLGGACSNPGGFGECCAAVLAPGTGNLVICAPDGTCGGPGAACSVPEGCVSGVCCDTGCCAAGQRCEGGECVG